MPQKLSIDQKEQREKARRATLKANSKRSGRIVMIIIAIFTVGVLIYPGILGLFGYDYITSTGDRVGKVTQLSNSGLVWKTWEGTLALSQNGSVAENWSFSLDTHDPNASQKVATLKEVVDSGATIKLSYEKHLGIRLWRAQTTYTITDIKILSQSLRW